MKIKRQSIAILVLCFLIFGLVAYIVMSWQPKESKAEQFYKQYKIEAARRDSIISVLSQENDSLRIDRRRIREKLKDSQKKSKEQQKSLDALMYKIAALKKRINENLPNYADSTTNAIDDLLPK